MKKIINITKGLLVTTILSASLISCSEDAMDKVNKDLNHTTNIQAKFILSGVLTSTAFNIVGGDYSTYTSTYVEHEVGTDNQLYRAEHRQNEPSAASTFNNVWGSSYTALRNSRIMIDKCSVGGAQEGSLITKGMAEVMAAYNSAIIADMYGDAPWSEAALVNADGSPKFMNPKVDSQRDIYIGVMKYLDDAIADLQSTTAIDGGARGVTSYDLMYGGDKALWLKFAYGLKARYTMRLIARSADKPGDYAKVLDYVSKSFVSAAEQATFNKYDASNLNPLYDFYSSRLGLAASKSMSEKLIERNDPRLRREFVSGKFMRITGVADAAYLMAENGLNEEKKEFYNASIFVNSQTAPTIFMSYHEVLFLKAEALCRLNRSVEAQPVLKLAVVAAIANTEISVAASVDAPNGGITEKTTAILAAEAASYFDTSVLPLFTANPLKEVMLQKYIAFFGANGESVECYNDIRRMKALGENFVVLKNPLNATKFPLRCPYGTDDTTTNPNVKAVYGDGQYVYTVPVWWALGAR